MNDHETGSTDASIRGCAVSFLLDDARFRYRGRDIGAGEERKVDCGILEGAAQGGYAGMCSVRGWQKNICAGRMLKGSKLRSTLPKMRRRSGNTRAEN